MARILVADPNMEAADMLAAALRNSHAVRTCYSGTLCLKITHDFRPDVVLVRSGSIGAEVARQLRREVPIITIGADGDVKEPIDMLTLMQFVRRVIA